MSFNFRRSFLGATACKSTNLEDVYTGKYDLLVASSSWDRRCAVIAQSNRIESEAGLLLLFEKRDSLGLRDAHDAKLEDHLSSICEGLVTARYDSRDLESTWDFIVDKLDKTFSNHKRPLKIFVDLATIPRYFSLGILAYGIKHGLLEAITFGYSEGRYRNLSGNSVEWFTEGGWDAVAIPCLEGEWEPQNKRLYVVSIGFEGAKTQRLITKAEPDRVAVLYPDPPVQPDYADEVALNNGKLTRDFNIADRDIVRAHAADAVSAWRSLDAASVEKLGLETCIYACCGSKPHSLALALRAMSTGVGAVMYVVPDSHRVSDVQPNGTYWQYTIRDHSVLERNRE
ncbi:hypothetical protein [Neorhodopirellula lusitana]|nr:hypothetical protein [Neorhodopirellula lusitana]